MHPIHLSRFCAQCGQSLNEVSQPQPTKQPITTATEKPKTADELTAEGFQFAQEGQWERAIQKYREAIAIDSNNGRAHTNLGYALNRVGQFEQAIAALTKAISLTNQDVHLYRIYDLRGFSKVKLTDYAGAIADYTSSLSYNTDDPPTFLHRAQARAQIGELSKALQDVNKALRLDPENHHAIRLKRRLEADGAPNHLALHLRRIPTTGFRPKAQGCEARATIISAAELEQARA
jgi:tetratricopeptide (TPR) repeat protein